jgi:HD-GYP domain-containing protein (c-di-GMP phosphodiesterase class II)
MTTPRHDSEPSSESGLTVDATATVNDLISAVSMAMDIEEGVKLYHGWRVAILAAELARRLDREPVDSFYAGLLHDVGGVGLPHHLVNYLAMDAADDRDHPMMVPSVISHPLLSAEIVSALPGIGGAARAVFDHHEDWNGHGFPRGLVATEIGTEAQVLHVADVVDLMLRSEPVPSEDRLAAAIASRASSRFAPDVAECTIEILRAGLYEQLVDVAALPALFEATRESVGDVPVSRGTDAVGVTLDVLSRVVDNKHPYTIGHSRRVARYALLIGIGMGRPHDELTLLKWAALIHDVGKLSTPTRVLDKPTALTQDEMDTMRFHACYTLDIVSAIRDLRPVAISAASHHEWYDGSGYPLGWSGEEIPLDGRIIAVCDAFDAMTSDRAYRSSRGIDLACDEIENRAGTQFDPGVVRAAIPVLRNMGLVMVGA